MAKVEVGCIVFESDTPEQLFKFIERCFNRDCGYRNFKHLKEKYFNTQWLKADAIEEQERLWGFNSGIWNDIHAILEWYIKYGKDHPRSLLDLI